MSSYEIDWSDVIDFAVTSYFGAGIVPAILYYQGIENLAEKTPAPTPSRHAWFMRPAVAAAKETAKFFDYLDRHEGLAMLTMVASSAVGIIAGITAMCFAGPWLGATWAGLATLHGIGLGLGTLGIGAAVAPVVALATSVTGLIITPTVVNVARGWQNVKAEIVAGRAETKQWKQDRKDEKNGRPKPHPLIAAAEARHVDLSSHGLHERARLFHRLKEKFPAEFDEAVRRTDHDTVLRDKVKVCKKIVLKPHMKQRSFSHTQRGGG